MNLSILNSSIKGFLENPILKSNDFEAFTKLLMQKELLKIVKSYLKSHLQILCRNYHMLDKKNKKDRQELEKDISYSIVRKFMSLFLFIHFPSIHKLDKGIKICKDLINISRQLLFVWKGIVIFVSKHIEQNTLENINQNTNFKMGYLPVVYSFFSKLDRYLDLFERWKKYDLENLIFTMSYDYFKFEQKMLESGNLESHPELIEQCDRERQHILELVVKLDSNNGKIKFREYLDVIEEFDRLNDEIAHQLFLQKISNLIHTNCLIEEWDVLEIELEENKYEKLSEMLVKCKEAMKDCKPKSSPFHQQLEEVLDEEFIISQIKNHVFDLDNFRNLVDFILKKLENFQSPSEDHNTILFKDELNILLVEVEVDRNLPFIIRFFLENIYLKFDNIRRQIYIFSNTEDNQSRDD